MLYFSTFIEVYLKRTEAIRSFTKFSIFSVVEYKETIHALPVSGLSNIEILNGSKRTNRGHKGSHPTESLRDLTRNP